MKFEIGLINVEWLRNKVLTLESEVKKSENARDELSAAAFSFELKAYSEVLRHVERLTQSMNI